MKNILKIILILATITSYSQNRYEIKLTEFNSKVSDFGPAYTPEGLIFASERDTMSASNKRHLINGKLRPFLQLFFVDKEDSKAINRLKKAVNKKYHESTVALTNDGNSMYFTRNNYFHKRVKKDSNDINLLKLFKSTKQSDGSWGDVEELPFNNDHYSVAHPTLNSDNSRLYFASDMPGTLGKSDIWYVTISDDNTYGVPVNLGQTINTTGSDTFPFISKKGDLYFASDTHIGHGGLDMFVSLKDENYTNIHNLGEPINTISDDFSLIFNEEDKTGYFSSNRESGLGDDDIYEFKELIPLVAPCDGTISGMVKDGKGIIITAANVVLTDINGKELNRMKSDSEGKYHFNIDCNNKKYAITGTKISYEKDIKSTQVTREEKNPIVDLVLKAIVNEVAIGVDLTKELDLNPIYFDLDKSYIRTDAAIELQKVIAYMKKYPNIKIQVRSHTDSRGSDDYNLKLSDRRAKSTAKYIIDIGGISSNRVTGMGYGETQLQNHCSNGIKCSKTEHQLNRRSEFIVVDN